MEYVEVRRAGYLPTNIPVRPNSRIDKLAAEISEQNRAIRDLEKEIRSLEAQKLEPFSVESSQKQAAVKRQLAAAERRLLEHQAHRKRVQDERAQWVDELALRGYRRRLLWQELAEARPGPVSNWSISRMYAIGEKEQRTTGDVRRDLIEDLKWLIRFGGEDAELQQELTQLSQQQAEAA